MTIRTSQFDRELAITRAEQWCVNLDTPFFFTENKSGTHAADVRELLSLIPSLTGTVWEALIWLRVGLITRAHDLVQDAGTGIEAYIHGMIHRLEGDYWNAKYWFRNAGRSTIRQVTEQMNVHEPTGTFDPSLIVDRLEQFARTGPHTTPPQENSRNSEKQALAKILEQEWWAVWHACSP